MKKYSRGEIYYANLNPVLGSEQSGCRPVLILQNNTGNRYSPTVIVAPITTSGHNTRKMLPTHCPLPVKDGLEKPSFILLEQLRTLDKRRFGKYLGKLDHFTMQAVDRALAISVGLPKPDKSDH